jgi:hypothetical protein
LLLAIIAAGLGIMVGALRSRQTCRRSEGPASRLAALGAIVALAGSLLL